MGKGRKKEKQTSQANTLTLPLDEFEGLQLANQLTQLDSEACNDFDKGNYIEAARKYIQWLRLIEAISNYHRQNMPTLDNATANTYIMLTRCYLAQNKIARARVALENAKKFSSDQSHYFEAKILLAEGKEISEDLCQTLLLKIYTSDHANAQNALTVLLQDFELTKQQHFDETVVEFILTSDKFDTQHKIDIANYAHLQLGKTELALSCLEKSSAAENPSANMKILLASLYHASEQFDLAEKFATAAINARDSNDTVKGSAYYILALVVDDSAASDAEHRLAVRYYEEAVEFGHTEAHHNLGYKLVYGEGIDPNPEAGVRHLQAALRVAMPINGLTLTELGICYKLGLGVTADQTRAEEYLVNAYKSHRNVKAGHHPLRAMERAKPLTASSPR